VIFMHVRHNIIAGVLFPQIPANSHAYTKKEASVGERKPHVRQAGHRREFIGLFKSLH
jgi:hypothetical protein